MYQAGISTGHWIKWGLLSVCLETPQVLWVIEVAPRPWFLQTGVVSAGGKGYKVTRLTLLVTAACSAGTIISSHREWSHTDPGRTISLTTHVLAVSDTGVCGDTMHAFCSGSSQFKGWKMGKCPVAVRPGLEFAAWLDSFLSRHGTVWR